MGTEREQRLKAALKQMADAAEMLWGVVANVSGGDWSQQNRDWYEAAIRWRDNYHAALETYLALSTPPEATPEPPTPELDVCDPEIRVQMPTRTVKGYRPRLASTPEPERPAYSPVGQQQATSDSTNFVMPLERPAARCVWTSGWQVEPWSGTCGAYASYRPLRGWAYCPYCGQPLVVEP